MVEFKNSDDLKNWLEGKPQEFSVVIASRAALRVLPVLNELFEGSGLKEEYSASIILSVFRAMTLSLAAAKFPANGRAFVVHAALAVNATDTAAMVGVSSSNAVNAVHAANFAADTATSVTANAAADTARVSAAAYIVAAAAHAARAATNIFGAAGAAGAAARAAALAAADAASAADATHLEQGIAPEQLARYPLWEDDMPMRLIEHWDSLKKNLLALNVGADEDWNQQSGDEDWNEGNGSEDWNKAGNAPDWQVWTDWYEAILAGRNRAWLPDDLAEELDLKIATKENGWWQRGPAKVNRDIAEWTAAAREKATARSPDNQGDVIGLVAEFEPQNAGVVRFISQDGGPIGIYHAPEEALLNDKGAIDRHFEVRRLSEALVDSFDPTEMGANSVAQLIEDVRNYRSALGREPSSANIDFVIPRGDGLRMIIAAQNNIDDLSDLPPISDKYKLKLEQLVRAHNIYVSLDPVLAKRDEALLGPDAKINLVLPQEGMQIVRDAVESGIANPEVAAVLGEDANIAPVIPDPENRISRRSSEGFKNFARQVVADVSDWIGNQALNHKSKIAKGVIGTVVVSGVVSAYVIGGIAASVGGLVSVYVLGKWMLENEDWFLDSFSDKPVMLEIVKEIFKNLKKLPLG